MANNQPTKLKQYCHKHSDKNKVVRHDEKTPAFGGREGDKIKSWAEKISPAAALQKERGG